MSSQVYKLLNPFVSRFGTVFAPYIVETVKGWTVMKWLLSAIAGALSVLAFVIPALATPIGCFSATSCSFSLDNFIGTGTPPAGPYGTVTLTQNGGNIDVSVGLVPVGQTFFAQTGAGEALLWDMNGAPALTVNLTGASIGNFTFDPSAGHQDGSGDWNYGFICSSCGSGGSPPHIDALTFTIDNHVLADFIKNDLGNNFASDLCIGYTAANGCGLTGDVLADASGRGHQVPVPEPATIALFGAGLVGLGLIRRRRGAKTA